GTTFADLPPANGWEPSGFRCCGGSAGSPPANGWEPPGFCDGLIFIALPPADHRTDSGLIAAESVLTQRFRPEAVAMAVIGLSDKADVAAAGDFLPDAAEIGSQFKIYGYTHQSILESGPEPVRHFLFDGRGERHRFDLPAETFFGS